MRDYPAEYDEENLNNAYFAEAFPDTEGLGDLYRQTYKWTPCGPSMGATITYVKVFEPDYGSDMPYEEQVTETLYCDNLYKLGTWAQMDDQGILLLGLCVSSIVEGVDYETETIEVDAKQLDEEPEKFAARFSAAVEKINKEADSIWNDTHGCESCAKHWGIDFDAECGNIPVWTECAECGGSGTVI